MEALFSYMRLQIRNPKHEARNKFKIQIFNDQNNVNQDFEMDAGKLELIQVT
jgi:hypothetical protein